jgi:hypothetical protein
MTDACISPFMIAAAREARTARAIMAGQIDAAPVAEQLRIIAQQLAGGIEAGEYRRLPADSLCGLRGLSMAVDALAERLEDERPLMRRMPTVLDRVRAAFRIITTPFQGLFQ